MDAVIDVVVEIFAWAGIGLGALFAGIALVLFLLDGTWVHVRAVVERVGTGHVVRWFDEAGGVNEAPISEDQHRELGGKDMADIYARRGMKNRMRLTPRSPSVRATALLGGGLLALGMLALVVSWILLFARG